MAEILILYYSKSGSVKNMASIIARGVNSVDGVSAKIRTVQEVSVSLNKKEKLVPDSGSPYATLDDLKNCDGLALGSPTRFGNMAAHLKFFLDSASSVWLKGSLENKPASVFTSSSSNHGGNESTLLSMQLPLQHMGMILVGIPYSIPELSKTKTGGTPYGASHVGGDHGSKGISEEEKIICFAQGVRLAKITAKLLNE